MPRIYGSPRGKTIRIGSSPYRTTASVLIHNIRIRSSACSSASTGTMSMKEQESGLRSANALSTAMAEGSGSNPSPAKDPLSGSASRPSDDTADRGIPILIVEDNAGDISLLRTALKRKRLDGQISVVRDGEAALKFADSLDSEGSSPGDSQPQAVCPQLVILDLNLPKVNGREILKRFRASARLSTVPIVILSSSQDDRDKVAVLNLGATRYLHKPLNLEEFMDIGSAVEALLSGSDE